MTAIAQSVDAARRRRRRGRLGRPRARPGRASSTCRPSGWPRWWRRARRSPTWPHRRWRTGGRILLGGRRRGREGRRVAARRPRPQQPGQGRAARVAERARRSCWSGCASTPSGPASRRSRSPRTSRAGPGWRATPATCGPRSPRCDDGRAPRPAGTCAPPGTDYHAVFLAGLLPGGRRAGPGRRRSSPTCGASDRSGPITRPRPGLPPRLPARRPGRAPRRRWPSCTRRARPGSAAAAANRRTTWSRPRSAAGARHRTGCDQLADAAARRQRWPTASDAGRRPARRGRTATAAAALAGYRRRPPRPRCCPRRYAAPRTSAPPAACSPRPIAGRRPRTRSRRPATLLAGWAGWRVAELDGRCAAGSASADAGRATDRRRGADPARTGGRAADRRRADQRRAGPPAVHLAEDRGRARLQHPAQARRLVAHRGRRLAERTTARLARRSAPLEVPGYDRLLIGVLGAARITPAALIKPARGLPDVTRHRRRRPGPGPRRRVRGHARRTVAHDSYAELVHDPDIDAVYVPLPNGRHARVDDRRADRR